MHGMIGSHTPAVLLPFLRAPPAVRDGDVPLCKFNARVKPLFIFVHVSGLQKLEFAFSVSFSFHR